MRWRWSSPPSGRQRGGLAWWKNTREAQGQPLVITPKIFLVLIVLADVTPRALRHTFAKSLIDNGVSLEKVAALPDQCHPVARHAGREGFGRGSGRAGGVEGVMKKLTRNQWYALDEQYNQTPAHPDAEGVPGEHLRLMALLNRLGFHPMSKQEAMQMARELLERGWE